MPQTITLTAPDITCDNCVRHITEAVGALEGARVVAASSATKQVTVEFDSAKLTLDQIEATMADEGYPVQGA